MEYGYFVTRKLNVNIGTSYQNTHGGLDWAHDVDGHDEETFHTHDQTAAADWWRGGVGLWYSVGVVVACFFPWWIRSTVKTLMMRPLSR